MAPLARTCSECGEPLSNPRAKTCGSTCRAKRSRRLKRQKSDAGKQNAYPPHVKELSQVVRNEAPDIAHSVIQEELRPVVREALTEDVLQAINRMVALTPAAIGALEQDLHSEDPQTRQRAYTLLIKYTVGHQAIVRPEEGEDSKQLIVHFNLPRPELGGVTQEDGEEVIAEAEEYRHCNMCDSDKPVTQFVANSDRCEDCHVQMKSKVKELLGDDA